MHAVDIIKGKGLFTNTELNPESQLEQSLTAHVCQQRMSQFLAVSSLLDLRRMFRAAGADGVSRILDKHLNVEL